MTTSGNMTVSLLQLSCAPCTVQTAEETGSKLGQSYLWQHETDSLQVCRGGYCSSSSLSVNSASPYNYSEAEVPRALYDLSADAVDFGSRTGHA